MAVTFESCDDAITDYRVSSLWTGCPSSAQSYRRILNDLACSGRPVRCRLHIRRFFCASATFRKERLLCRPTGSGSHDEDQLPCLLKMNNCLLTQQNPFNRCDESKAVSLLSPDHQPGMVSQVRFFGLSHSSILLWRCQSLSDLHQSGICPFAGRFSQLGLYLRKSYANPPGGPL